MRIESWVFREAGKQMQREQRDELPQPGQVVVEVAGCGVCHTDLGFFYDGVPTRHPLPLTLGHEVSGRVVEAGEGAESWIGKGVIVPAVIPCGDCDACRAGRGSICPKQIFPGNDVHGGFASHLTVPAHGLCEVPDLTDPANNPEDLDLATLSVIADAVSTPYQAIRRANLAPADLAVFVGAGGVGGFGVQMAAAMDAHVIAIDVDDAKLETLKEYGAHLVLNSGSEDFRSLKKAVKGFAKEHGIPSWRWRIFETSGHPEGQVTAFGLMGHGSYLSIVGYTPAKTTVRLSNLMALDATAEGNWGCLPELYPEVLDMVLEGRVKLAPFTEHRPLSTINETFADVHAHRIARRPILTPES
ncbi:MAG: 6-hydroxycyclohex-1-ene-1-carbonyl-CoA dehydrogenase [Planctomycetota bacterium]